MSKPGGKTLIELLKVFEIENIIHKEYETFTTAY